MTDHVKNQLCARIEELEKEKLELNEQLDALQEERDALAAPVVQGEPVAFRYRTSGSAMWNYVDWRGPDEVEKDNFEIQYLSAAPQPAEQQSAPYVAALVDALEQIERWDGFPPTDKTWEGSGEPVSYGAAFGSNGERDFMREVARKALAAAPKPETQP